MAVTRDSVTTVILAGGRATRLPGKLERVVAGEPLLLRVYRSLKNGAPAVVSAAGSFAAELDARLDCPVIVDRRPGLGPLGGLLSACEELRSEWIFAVAGDAPNVDGAVFDALRLHASDDVDAVVPAHAGGIEPLAALYRRAALEREGYDVLQADRSMHGLLARIRVRRVAMPQERFLNVNTFADLATLNGEA
jgi:molybdopterin-guanine dinucleotide biosynthesis protein A